MRVYLPATLDDLRPLLAAREVGPAPLNGFAITPALREWYVAGDEEELEYAALSAAARASLRLLHDHPEAPARRLVLAADVPDATVRPAGERERGAVRVTQAVPLARLAAVHVDAPEAEPDVCAAAAAVPAAERGDADAAFTVDAAMAHELQWYATQELPDLLR